jgi:hypothetical protein
MKTVKRSDLSTWKMVAGNEDVYNKVIDGNVVKEWAAIGWIDTGPPSDEDKATLPTVVEE